MSNCNCMSDELLTIALVNVNTKRERNIRAVNKSMQNIKLSKKMLEFFSLLFFYFSHELL